MTLTVMAKAYRLKLYPSVEQRRRLAQYAGVTQLLRNHLLGLHQKTYERDKKFVFRFEMQAMLPLLKHEHLVLRPTFVCGVRAQP